MKIKIEEQLKKIETIRQDIEAAILRLPDNPNIKRIGKSPNCFVMSSKTLFASNNWTAFYHDFKKQYQRIVEIISTSAVEHIMTNLNTIITTGRYQQDKFHPDVIDHLKNLVKE